MLAISLSMLCLFICVAGAKATPRKPITAAAKRWHPDRQWLHG